MVQNLRREARNGSRAAPGGWCSRRRCPIRNIWPGFGWRIFFSTLPDNAHTLASDALWAGCPVITCAGETFASRVAGLAECVRLPELVTTCSANYEASFWRPAGA